MYVYMCVPLTHLTCAHQELAKYSCMVSLSLRLLFLLQHARSVMEKHTLGFCTPSTVTSARRQELPDRSGEIVARRPLLKPRQGARPLLQIRQVGCLRQNVRAARGVGGYARVEREVPLAVRVRLGAGLCVERIMVRVFGGGRISRT